VSVDGLVFFKTLDKCINVLLRMITRLLQIQIFPTNLSINGKEKEIVNNKLATNPFSRVALLRSGVK
jgi:hypothetical protein